MMTYDELDGLEFTDVNGGKYFVEINQESGKTIVTVDYELKKKVGDLHPIGRHCIFSKKYEDFSVVQLVVDLNKQHHGDLADYILAWFNV
jgi:major membrane immunogen (membrane-anchored lipoprotein)